MDLMNADDLKRLMHLDDANFRTTTNNESDFCQGVINTTTSSIKKYIFFINNYNRYLQYYNQLCLIYPRHQLSDIFYHFLCKRARK